MDGFFYHALAQHFHQYIGAVSSVASHEPFASIEIPAMTWAIFEVDGDWTHVEELWQRIYTEWFSTVPYELIRPEMLASQNDKSEIWIGIREK
ncbi:GyrI-like domain-containing protein [Shouchella sp. 1P09AA]|uniref:GyrI-like domain-containing protein n=1 Tax=unclassified Shouchella TaxID=2893065 RepID=UPI0039A016A5